MTSVERNHVDLDAYDESFVERGLVSPGEAMPITSKPSEAEIASDFDRIAETFFQHKHDEVTGFDVVGWPWIELMLNHSVDGKVVADLASGTGAVADKLLRNYEPKAVILVDISKKMLDVGRREIKNSRARFVQSSVVDMSFMPDNAIDLAICVYGLDYMDVPKALKETSRVLKPEGRFISLVPHPDRNKAYWDAGGNTGPYPDGWVVEAWPGSGDTSVKKQYFKYSTWSRLMRESPFEVVNIEEPTPPRAAASYAPQVYQKYQETGHRILIFDMINRKADGSG